jgi:hypothetical protein
MFGTGGITGHFWNKSTAWAVKYYTGPYLVLAGHTKTYLWTK